MIIKRQFSSGDVVYIQASFFHSDKKQNGTAKSIMVDGTEITITAGEVTHLISDSGVVIDGVRGE
ncbi:hypothetical protein ACISK3_05345 [Morganella morganii]|nr:hypothetical protein [Morganella morganii]